MNMINTSGSTWRFTFETADSSKSFAGVARADVNTVSSWAVSAALSNAQSGALDSSRDGVSPACKTRVTLSDDSLRLIDSLSNSAFTLSDKSFIRGRYPEYTQRKHRSP